MTPRRLVHHEARATGLRAALVLALASGVTTLAFFAGCAAADARRPPAVTPVPPLTSSMRPARVAESADAKAPESGESTRHGSAEAGSTAEPRRPPAPPPEPSFGAGSVKPGDPQGFRLVAALRAARANPSSAKILLLMSALPAVIAAKTRTAVDPFADGEWLLVYGAQPGVPGANASVVRHGRPETEVTMAIADAGFEPREAGPPGALRAELYGVHDVLLRPQPATLALVPSDRAADLGAALARPLDPAVKNGELARIFVAEPAPLVRGLPSEVTRASVLVKPNADGGLDLSADADCGDAPSCSATATALQDLVARQNSMLVRLATRSLLSGLGIRADGTKLRATLHASPEQVDAIVNLVRAQLDLPP